MSTSNQVPTAIREKVDKLNNLECDLISTKSDWVREYKVSFGDKSSTYTGLIRPE
jgi:hypothetical protein